MNHADPAFYATLATLGEAVLIEMRVKPRPSGRERKARSDMQNVAAMAE